MESNGTNSLRKLRRDWWKTRLCVGCVSPLGRIISRGGICPQCGLRVCKNCRSETQPGSGVEWVCVLCSNGGIPPDIFGKTKSLGRDSRSIRRSWTISTPQRAQTSSPILKSYTLIQPEESLGVGETSHFNTTGSGHVGSVSAGSQANSNNEASSRQFHSLPRMSSGSERAKKTKRSFNQDFEKENIKRHRSFQSTLHPYHVPTPPSPSASINFIEDIFWDYYDYDIGGETPSGSPRSPNHSTNPRFRSLTGGGGGSASILQRRNSIRQKLESDMDRLLKLNMRTHSNRSSCERSLGETYDYDYSKNYSHNSNYNSLSDTELNDNSKYDQQDDATFSPRRFNTEQSTNFYKFATVTPINMSPLSDTRKESSSSNTSTNINDRNNIATRNFSTNNPPSTSTPTPVKPERKCNRNKRSFSLNSYDTKKLFSPLRTYVVVMKENIVPRTNNISDANANANNVPSSSSPAITRQNNSSNNMKVKNQHASNNTSSIRINSVASASASKESEFNSPTKFHSLPRERVIKIDREDWKFARPKENTSLLNSSSPSSFGERKRNVSKVEITRSMSSASGKDYKTVSGNGTELPIEKSGRRIARSQSHREISSVNQHHHPTIITYEQVAGNRERSSEAPFLSVVNLRSSPSPNSGGGGIPCLNAYDSATLPLIRSKEDRKSTSTTLKSSNQSPLLSSLLDDKDTATVMENFLRSPSQHLNPTQTSRSPSLFKSSRGCSTSNYEVDAGTNEKCSTPSKKSDFVPSQMSDFQRQQIQTFDNYLRQCSTFPRQKHSNLTSQQETERDKSFEPKPKSRIRHTSTTLITHDDNFVKSWDNLDEHFQPIGETSRARARSDVQLNNRYNDYPSTLEEASLGPIVFMKQSEPMITTRGGGGGTGIGPTPGWSATLPHPYIRKHKQEKSSFIAQQQHQQQLPVADDDAFSKEKTRISNVEQEIEQDIYFQKTKSLDRAKPSRPKTSIFDTKFERSQVIDPPVASPRLKRKVKLLASNPDVSSGGGSNVPKINAEQQYHHHHANGTGTNYPMNKNNTHLPNEPRPCRNLNTIINSIPPIPIRGGAAAGLITTHSHNSNSQSQPNPNANKFILENQSQFANSLHNSNNSSQLNKLSGTKITSSDSQIANSGELTKSKMKMPTNYNQKSAVVEQPIVDGLPGESPTPPIATPRTRRKNNQHHSQDSSGVIGLDEITSSGGSPDFHDFNNTPINHDHGTMDGDAGIINGKLQSQLPPPPLPPASANNHPKAVRFEPHIIEMENERKHNKGSRTNNQSAINSGSGMRMNNNFNNKLRTHLGTYDSGDDITNGNNNVATTDDDDVPIFSPQFNPDSSSRVTSAYPPYNYNAGKSVYTFGGPAGPGVSEKSLKSIKKPNNSSGGFVARAIAKVKSTKLKKSNLNKTNLINSNNKLRYLETRDSITYISPPPTQQQYQNFHNNKNNQSTGGSVINEITLNSAALSSGNANDYDNDDHSLPHVNLQKNSTSRGAVISRSESFTKAGILKNASSSLEHHPPQQSSSANTTPTRNSQNLNKSPPKPKRSSLKNTGPANKMEPSPEEDNTKDNPLIPSLSIDQLTPSSTSSSSSSSYLSNLQESYEFFNASEEEYKSIDEEEDEAKDESDRECTIFKSFDDDEDAGEDFIFYSQTDSVSSSGNKDKDYNSKTKARMTSHAYNPKTSSSSNPQNHNQIVSLNNNQRTSTNYREICTSSGSTNAKSQPKDIITTTTTTTTNSPNTSSYGDHHKKGLTSKQVVVLRNNGQDADNLLRHHHHHLHNEHAVAASKYVDDITSSRNSSASEFHYGKGAAPSTTPTSTPLLLRNSNTTTRLSALPPSLPLLPSATTTTIHNFNNHYNSQSSKSGRNQQGITLLGENNKNSSPGESHLNYPNIPQPPPPPPQYLSQFHASSSAENEVALQKEERQNFGSSSSHFLESFNLPKNRGSGNNNNLLHSHFTSEFAKSATLPSRKKQQNFAQVFSESEFFPGAQKQENFDNDDVLGMSSLPHDPLNHQRIPKFRSSVLVNNSGNSGSGEEESELLLSSPKIPAIPRQPGRNRNQQPTKNVTTVEISGDVGIVNSQAASDFLNHRRAALKKVNNENLWKNDSWKNDVYSSGLSQLKQQRVSGGEEEDEEVNDNKHGATGGSDSKVDHYEEDITLGASATNSELGSTIAHNGSNGSSSDTTPKNSVSDDGDGSDWNSESTRNTVIFRGAIEEPVVSSPNGCFSNSSESLPQSPSSSGRGGVFQYNCDPEIHISGSVDLVDNNNENTGSYGPGDSIFSDTEITTNCVKATAISAKSTKINANSNKALDDKSIDKKDNGRTVDRKNVKPLDKDSIGSGDCDTLSKGRNGVSNASEPVTDLYRNVLTTSESIIPELDRHSTSQEPLVPAEELEEMVHYNLDDDKVGDTNFKSSPRAVPSNAKSTKLHPRRESPEGQEQEVPVIHQDDKANVKKPESKKSLRLGEVIIMENPHKSSGKVISKSEISQNVMSRITASSSRSSPDGADADRDSTPTTEPENDSPTPMVEQFDVTSDEDSWVEEILFDDDAEVQMCRKAQPPVIDRHLHTIVEESCEESEPESGNFNSPQKQVNQTQRKLKSQNDNELEKYFNFGVNTSDNGSQGGRQSFTNEDSEFSDTFSESSFSMQDDHDESIGSNSGRKRAMDPAELASSRLEKYFYNLGLPQSMMNPINSVNQNADSDSVGSESESDNSVLENRRKKVLKHHRRSADFEDEFGDKVSDEEDGFGFGQDGFDTIKKTARKGSKKSGSDSNLLECGATGVGSSSKISENPLSTSTADSPLRLPLLSESNSRVTKSPLGKTLSNGTSSSKEDSSSTSPPASKKSSPSGDREKDRPVIKVNRSNSFQWSSDEEVNIMMSKLRQLIRNLVKAKAEPSNSSVRSTISGVIPSSSHASGDKDKQLAYLEGELIRLMKTENLKNIVEYFSSEESDVDDVYKFIKVVKESSSNADDSDFGDIDFDDPKLLQTLQIQSAPRDRISPKESPELLSKVMHHIEKSLSVWMKDENMQDDDNNDDNATLKLHSAQSVSSDLNEDRFSWKGSFESALAAKRQSVGSTDSISSSDFTQDRSILRSSSLHHLANSSHHLGQVEEHKEEEETSSLPRMTNLCNSQPLCNSLPRLNQPSNLSISRAHSLVISGKEEEDSPVTATGPIKSARYRPPGFQPVKSKRMDDEGKNNSILSQSTPMLTRTEGLKVRSDSVGSIFHDATKAHIPVKGQVEFGLQYNYKLACLEVRVKQCRELAAVDAKRNRSDPYVKAYLLPDRSKNGKRKTKVRKNTINPVFEEILKFPLTLSDLQNRTLWLSVWHSDIFGKNEFLGEVLVDLKDRVFDDPNPSFWDLQEMSGQTEDMPRGDVVIALKWQPKTDSTGNLSVLVKEAKNLTPVKNGGSPSSLIKCSLLSDKSRKHKTSICRRSYNPVWNQTLCFEDAGDEGLEITLWNYDLLSNNDLLGTVRMEYDNPLWTSMLSRHSFWVEGILRLT